MMKKAVVKNVDPDKTACVLIVSATFNFWFVNLLKLYPSLKFYHLKVNSFFA